MTCSYAAVPRRYSLGRAGNALVSQEMTSHITDSSGRNTILSGQHKSRPNFERHANEISQCQLHLSFSGKPIRKMHQNTFCSSRGMRTIWVHYLAGTSSSLARWAHRKVVLRVRQPEASQIEWDIFRYILPTLST